MTKDEQGYNGWTNYETWCVNLWLDNEESTYRDVRTMAVDVIEREEADTVEDQRARCRYELADELKGYVESLAELEVPGLFDHGTFVLDLYQAAVGNVDWYEIASNLIDEELAVR